MRVWSSKIAIFASFARYIFLTFAHKTISYLLLYVVPYQLSLTPKQMTLNYIEFEWTLCAKVCLDIGMSLVFVFWLSVKTVRNFAELYTYSSKKCSQETLSFWRYKFYAVSHLGSLKRQRQTGEQY